MCFVQMQKQQCDITVTCQWCNSVAVHAVCIHPIPPLFYCTGSGPSFFVIAVVVVVIVVVVLFLVVVAVVVVTAADVVLFLVVVVVCCCC